MKEILSTLAASGLVLASVLSNSVAQEEEGPSAAPIELYACKYNDGQGPADLERATDMWNAWADERELKGYTAWTLVPFYFGPEQDFDFIWMGASQDAKTLGRAQDDWLANGGEIQAEFSKVSDCDAHGNFATLQTKEPPEREDESSAVVSFSDCNIADGKNFADDVAPALDAWAEHRTGQGSNAGHWVLFPAYGGGGEEFDFKFVTSHANFEEQGSDYDNYDPDKATELFAGLLDCDSSRVYVLTARRSGMYDEE